ncbi:LysR family transcriptional regulator [Bradyrhizobium sp. LTSP857]|uniref:LysR family transcriptional regulator n=1 Tax=Bradyrhizobium sp. LTSP857 TaxID=1619231 RepID=UPI0005DD59AC|nr:LysR family transcriptional regulator [Bradyrhizobium sp. LTSP857]KJC45757.1 LysR family transcriptional regulator [Bradyrhizobium sp. LTSP857]
MANDKRPPDARPQAVDLQQLRFAVTAADIGSFRQAADVLRLRQSQLSRCIRQLEHSIGVIVFERSSGGVKPTPGGREFLRTARIILEQVDSLAASAKTSSRGEAGRLAVGFCTSLSTGNLRAALLDFKVRFPHIELATVERSRTRLTTALRNGTLDILVVTGTTPLLENKTLPLWRERILVALPEDHPLTTRDVVLWTDLRNQTVLLSQYDPGRELEDVLISKLPLPEDRPQIERHDVSRGIIKSLISMRLGISLVMESDIGASFAGLVYRELRDEIRPSCISFSAHWRGDNENPALHDFLKLLTERYPSPAGND